MNKNKIQPCQAVEGVLVFEGGTKIRAYADPEIAKDKHVRFIQDGDVDRIVVPTSLLRDKGMPFYGLETVNRRARHYIQVASKKQRVRSARKYWAPLVDAFKCALAYKSEKGFVDAYMSLGDVVTLCSDITKLGAATACTLYNGAYDTAEGAMYLADSRVHKWLYTLSHPKYFQANEAGGDTPQLPEDSAEAIGYQQAPNVENGDTVQWILLSGKGELRKDMLSRLTKFRSRNEVWTTQMEAFIQAFFSIGRISAETLHDMAHDLGITIPEEPCTATDEPSVDAAVEPEPEADPCQNNDDGDSETVEVSEPTFERTVTYSFSFPFKFNLGNISKAKSALQVIGLAMPGCSNLRVSHDTLEITLTEAQLGPENPQDFLVRVARLVESVVALHAAHA